MLISPLKIPDYIEEYLKIFQARKYQIEQGPINKPSQSLLLGRYKNMIKFLKAFNEAFSCIASKKTIPLPLLSKCLSIPTKYLEQLYLDLNNSPLSESDEWKELTESFSSESSEKISNDLQEKSDSDNEKIANYSDTGTSSTESESSSLESFFLILEDTLKEHVLNPEKNPDNSNKSYQFLSSIIRLCLQNKEISEKDMTSLSLESFSDLFDNSDSINMIHKTWKSKIIKMWLIALIAHYKNKNEAIKQTLQYALTERDRISWRKKIVLYNESKNNNSLKKFITLFGAPLNLMLDEYEALRIQLEQAKHLETQWIDDSSKTQSPKNILLAIDLLETNFSYDAFIKQYSVEELKNLLLDDNKIIKRVLKYGDCKFSEFLIVTLVKQKLVDGKIQNMLEPPISLTIHQSKILFDAKENNTYFQLFFPYIIQIDYINFYYQEYLQLNQLNKELEKSLSNQTDKKEKRLVQLAIAISHKSLYERISTYSLEDIKHLYRIRKDKKRGKKDVLKKFSKQQNEEIGLLLILSLIKHSPKGSTIQIFSEKPLKREPDSFDFDEVINELNILPETLLDHLVREIYHSISDNKNPAKSVLKKILLDDALSEQDSDILSNSPDTLKYWDILAPLSNIVYGSFFILEDIHDLQKNPKDRKDKKQAITKFSEYLLFGNPKYQPLTKEKHNEKRCKKTRSVTECKKKYTQKKPKNSKLTRSRSSFSLH